MPMAAQAGKDLVLKLDDGTGAFVVVAGLRSRQLAFNAASVDVTNTESAGRWRELLAGAGVRRVGITGAGIFRNAGSDALVRATFFDGAIRNWQVIIPGFGTVQGPFLVTALDYKGEFDGAMTFELTLESAGAPTFTEVTGNG
jgi:TP901-1 family phage major tail protein